MTLKLGPMLAKRASFCNHEPRFRLMDRRVGAVLVDEKFGGPVNVDVTRHAPVLASASVYRQPEDCAEQPRPVPSSSAGRECPWSRIPDSAAGHAPQGTA